MYYLNKIKTNHIKKILSYIFLINLNFTNLNTIELKIPDFNSIINYTRSKIPNFDTVAQFIITHGTNNNTINISQIPIFSLFQPYMPKSAYNFLGNLKLKNIKATKDAKTSDEIISAETDIPVDSGKSITTNIRIRLGVNQVNTKVNNTNKIEKKAENENYWQQIEGYLNINNYINYAADYINSLKDSIMEEFASLKFGIVIELPQGFNFKELNPDLSFLDIAKFNQAALAIGTKFNDSVYGEIDPGLTVILKVELQEPFIKINNFIKNVSNNTYGLKENQFELKGHILPSITGTELKTPPSQNSTWGTFFFNLANKKLIEVHDLGIKLMSLPKGKNNTKGYSLGLSGGLKLYLNNLDSKLTPLDFTGFFEIDTNLQAKLTAKMNGLLDLSAIGLPLKFENVNINEALNISNMNNFNLDELKMSGLLNFGPKDNQANLNSTFNINFNDNNTNIFAYGNLTPSNKNNTKSLSLTDILNLSTKAYKELNQHADKFKSKIPEFGIKNAQFYFSPVTLLYNNMKLNSGITLDAALDLFGGSALVEFILDQTGFDAIGYTTSEINLGQVKILGAAKSSACLSTDTCAIGCQGTPTVKTEKIILPSQIKSNSTKTFKLNENNIPTILKDRPDFSKLQGGLINIRFHPPTDIAMLINARIKIDNLSIGNINSDACINISTNGINASFDQKIFGLLDTKFTAYAKDYQKPEDWYICGKMTPETENILGKAIANLINKAKTKATQEIDAANQKVLAAKKAYDKAFTNAQQKAKDAENEMRKKLEQAKRDCGS